MPAKHSTGRNASAVERTIAALRAGGRIESVDQATIALARHIASALDTLDPVKHPAQTASLCRVQLATLRSLRGIDDARDDGSIDDLLAALCAPVGDTEDAR